MRKIWAVVRREFVERVRSRWFWIMALVGPLFFGAVFVLPAVLARGGVKAIAVVDAATGSLGARITDSLNASRQFEAMRVSAGRGVTDSLTAEVEHKRLSGFLILSDATVDSGKAEYRGSNVSGFGTIVALERVVAEAVSAARLERAGVDPQLVAEARRPIHLKTEPIGRTSAAGETAAQSFSLAYFMGIILYTAILLYGINVMSSVLEEKTTRIVEVLVSSLRPFQLMLGKVLGVGAVSILQFVIWGAGARVLLARRTAPLATGDAADEMFQVPHVSAATLAIFMAYFLGGFFLYSSMFAAVGAMSSTEQEARQAQQPVAWLLVLSFISMFAMLNDPNSTLALMLSLVPLSSPIAMPVRWAAGSIPGYEIALSLVILLVSIVGVTWIAARIYRVGILMTGKRPNVKELVRWIRTA
jgi:ABC-2 type transport system permease protein